MPFCPKCRTEYVEGTVTCTDCGQKLVAELSPAEKQTPEQTDLVEVWHVQGEMDAQLIRSLLESNGIESMFAGESVRLTHGLTVDGLAEVRILVREEDAKRACEIIGSLEGMTQCTSCGYPASKEDTACYSCGSSLS